MSQKQTVLEHLRLHYGVSTWYAIKTWRITRLSRAINDLRNDGHNIKTKMVEHKGKRFAHYSLVK